MKSELRSKLYYPENRYAEMVAPENDSEPSPLARALRELKQYYDEVSPGSTINFSFQALQLSNVMSFAQFGSALPITRKPHDYSTNKEITFSVDSSCFSFLSELINEVLKLCLGASLILASASF